MAQIPLEQHATLDRAHLQWDRSRESQPADANAVCYEKIFADAVAAVRAEGRYRVFANLERIAGEYPFARNHGPGPDRVVVWCSNDYLAQGENPQVLKALCKAARELGAGSGGTRNISGTHTLHVALERELADLHAKKAALLFTSGYVSNSAAISTIARLLPG